MHLPFRLLSSQIYKFKTNNKMAKKKFPYILIKDAKNGFRTQLVGGNGEPLMTSEVLESAKAVKVNLGAAYVALMPSVHRDIRGKKDSIHLAMLCEIRYTGKSEAIYKMFKIQKES